MNVFCIPGTSICWLVDCAIVLHLCGYWDAGENRNTALFYLFWCCVSMSSWVYPVNLLRSLYVFVQLLWLSCKALAGVMLVKHYSFDCVHFNNTLILSVICLLVSRKQPNEFITVVNICFSVFFFKVFGGIKTGEPDSAITRYNNFQTFPAAALLLFR